MTIWADGKVIPSVVFPARVTMPDQRALIHFTNGTERLVIETRFAGAGTNFAWVVPLPAKPVIEAATTGLFPTLGFLFRPQIINEVPHYYVAILVITGVIIFIPFACRRSVNFLEAVVVILIFVVLIGMLLPSLAAAKRSMSAVSEDQPVEVMDRQLVGIYETATIASRDPAALQSWLRENGYAISSNAGPVIADYVKEGWVFVAAKIRRDRPEPAAGTPHPLSFTFPTERPVYPMRLTGMDNDSLKVELYVFGPERAEAPHFKVECCTRLNYPELSPGDFFSSNWLHSTPESPNIVHPLLRQWVDGAPVVTKLVATLSAADMSKDVWLDWTPFSEKKNQLYSRSGALTTALNRGSWFFGAGLLAVWGHRLFRKTSVGGAWLRAGLVISASLGVAGGIYLALPKIEVRVEKANRFQVRKNLFLLWQWIGDDKPATVAEISARAKYYLSNPTNDVDWVQFSRSGGWRDWDNNYLGGPIHEEDSPGNFTLRVDGGQIKLIGYDAQGAEHMDEKLMVWDLRKEP